MALSKELTGSDYEQTVRNVNCQIREKKKKIRYNLINSLKQLRERTNMPISPSQALKVSVHYSILKS